MKNTEGMDNTNLFAYHFEYLFAWSNPLCSNDASTKVTIGREKIWTIAAGVSGKVWKVYGEKGVQNERGKIEGNAV